MPKGGTGKASSLHSTRSQSGQHTNMHQETQWTGAKHGYPHSKLPKVAVDPWEPRLLRQMRLKASCYKQHSSPNLKEKNLTTATATTQPPCLSSGKLLMSKFTGS